MKILIEINFSVYDLRIFKANDFCLFSILLLWNLKKTKGLGTGKICLV